MKLDQVPYLVQSREIETGFALQTIYCAICLVRPTIMGIGLTRDEAMKNMITEVYEANLIDSKDFVDD